MIPSKIFVSYTENRSNNACTSTRREEHTIQEKQHTCTLSTWTFTPPTIPFLKAASISNIGLNLLPLKFKQNIINLVARKELHCKWCFYLSLPYIVFTDKYNKQWTTMHFPILPDELQCILGKKYMLVTKQYSGTMYRNTKNKLNTTRAILK